MIKLIGVLIIVIGFVLKLDTIAVVIVAGITTGLVSGLGFNEILEIIGSAFVTNRYMSIFLLSLPVIGLLERHGLRERASYLISKLKNATAGMVLSSYTLIRLIAAALSLRLGGHVQFIRPLIHPMANGALKNRQGEVNEQADEIIKGYAAASENIGNFFGQNVFVASGGVLLVKATLEELGYTVDAFAISKAAIPIAIIAFVMAFIQNLLVDRRLQRLTLKNKNQAKGGSQS